MALNDDAVLVGAQGFVYINTVGAVAPTPSELAALDPETYGAQVQTFASTGTPTGGTWTVKAISGDTPATVPWNATPEQLQAAIEGLDSVGAGNTVVTGTALTTGITVALVGPLLGTAVTYTIVYSGLTGGTTPTVAATVTTAANGWDNLGHTSRGEMPEFGFDGGKTEMKGTWQRKRLREVETGDPQEDSVKISLEQWDADTLELYFGENAAETPGIFGVSGDFNPVEKSILVVIIDGEDKLGFYAARASIQRDAAVKLPIDDFATLPIKATFLNLGTRRLYDWINEDLFS